MTSDERRAPLKIAPLLLFGLVSLGCRQKPTSEPLSDAQPKAETSLELYEKAMLDLASCSLGAEGIDRECPAWKAFEEGRAGKAARDLMPFDLASLGQKHLAHQSPAIRLRAAALLGSVLGAGQKRVDELIAAAKAEQHPLVLRALLGAIGPALAENSDVLTLVMAHADHAEAQVRREAVTWLTSPRAAGTAGTLEKAMELALGDVDLGIRRHACRRLGERADDRALALLEKLTAPAVARVDNDEYTACFVGLVEMWSARVVHQKPSKAAYELTLERLASERGGPVPPPAGLLALRWTKMAKFVEHAPWFDRSRLLGELEAVAADRKVDWMGRNAAIGTLIQLGVEPAVLERLESSYRPSAGDLGPDGLVHRKLARATGAAAKQAAPAKPAKTPAK